MSIVFLSNNVNANNVGYQENTVPEGYSMITPTFVNVSGGDYAIDNLILIGVDDTKATVQVVNKDGTWGTRGVWFNAYEELPAGWFTDASGETPADIMLEPGQAVFFKTTEKGASFQTAGQVAEDITIELPVGYSMIGNSTPLEMPIDSLTLIGVDDTKATVQVVNADGSWGARGVWFNAYEELPSGWFTDASGETPAGIVLAPGQSVFFKTTETGAKAIVPTALSTK